MGPCRWPPNRSPRADGLRPGGIAASLVGMEILHRSFPASLLLLLALAAGPVELRGQGFDIHPVISGEPSCPDGRLVVEKTRTLSGEHVVEAAQLQRDQRGRFYLWSETVPTAVSVFGPDGEFLRDLGGEGEGPGEFRFIGAISVGPGDTLRVYDEALRRVSTFLPDGLELVGTRRLPISFWPGGVLRLPDGRTVLNQLLRTEGGSGLPLHLVDAEGELVRSFGRQTRRMLPGDEPLLARELAEYRGDVVSVANFHYVVEMWDPDTGRLITGFERRPEGFRPRRRGEVTDPEEGVPPSSQVWDLRVDREGRLWVLAQVPVEDWEEHVEMTTFRHEEFTERVPRIDDIEAYDTVIDVIDLEARRLVATRRVDAPLRGWVDPGHAFSYREADGVLPRLDVWEVSLEPPPRRRR